MREVDEENLSDGEAEPGQVDPSEANDEIASSSSDEEGEFNSIIDKSLLTAEFRPADMKPSADALSAAFDANSSAMNLVLLPSGESPLNLLIGGSVSAGVAGNGDISRISSQSQSSRSSVFSEAYDDDSSGGDTLPPSRQQSQESLATASSSEDIAAVAALPNAADDDEGISECSDENDDEQPSSIVEVVAAGKQAHRLLLVHLLEGQDHQEQTEA